MISMLPKLLGRSKTERLSFGTEFLYILKGEGVFLIAINPYLST